MIKLTKWDKTEANVIFFVMLENFVQCLNIWQKIDGLTDFYIQEFRHGYNSKCRKI